MARFRGIKVRVNSPNQSETVQKALFADGCKWIGIEVGRGFMLHADFLFVSECGAITYEERDQRHFESHKNTEITHEEILGK